MFTIRAAARSQIYTNVIRSTCQSKYLFPITTQFHTTATQGQEDEFLPHKGSVQYKLRGKVKYMKQTNLFC